MQQELKNYLSVSEYLKDNYLERKEIIDGIMTAIIAQENILLIGPPGTAKSEIVMNLSKCFTGFNYFQWLLTKYTTPEELFGALSLKELELGIYKRNTTGKLPEAHIGFVDEIFKANSAILNSLLTLINERLFYNNGTPIKSPLMSLIGASNEFPEEDEGLEALNDRFLSRFMVENIKEDNNLLMLLKNKTKPGKITNIPTVSGQDVITLQAAAKQVNIPENVLNEILIIKTELAEEGILPSTRKWVKCLGLIKATALLESCNEADLTHLSCLRNILWTEPEEMDKVKAIVKKHCFDQFTNKLESIINTADDIVKNALNKKTTADATEAIQKLKDIEADLDKLKNSNPNKATVVDAEIGKIEGYKKEILKTCMGIDL
jgi:MoxR-like ATPase